MDRTKAIDNVAVRPAPSGSTHAAGYFADGTTVEAEFLNGVMDSLVVPLEDGGITPDTDDYEQFAKLLSGVHGIVSSVRTTLATVAVTTKSKQAAIAAESALCSAIDNAAIAGKTQAVTGNYCAAIAGQGQSVGAGTHSAALAGTSQTVTGGACAALAGVAQTVTGLSCAAIAGTEQTVGNDEALAAGGNHQITSGGACVVLGGQYYENIDNNCVCGGYGTSAPSNFGDGLTNKNITWKLHNDTGNAEFEGEVKVGCNVDDGTGTNTKLEADGDILHLGGHHCSKTQTLGISVDWNGNDEVYTTTSGISLGDTPDNTFRVAIINTDGSPHDIAQGQSILIPVTLNGLKILGGYAYVSATTAAASMQKTRWVVGGYYSAAAQDHIALTQVGEVAGVVGASTADSTAITVHLHVITPITTIA